jgi:spore coat polysaccharide biosynthesis protein SpsF
MMYPLDGTPVVEQIVRRVTAAELVETTTVATSRQGADDVIERHAGRASATVFRGSESDVLGRLYGAAAEHDAQTVVRVCADTPLMPPSVIDAVVRKLRTTGADYVTTTNPRSFPRGVDVEAFTFDSFREVQKEATTPHHREHVTPYYRENPDEFDIAHVSSVDVFDDQSLQNRTDLRLTLDEPDDYELLRRIYESVEFEELLPFEDAVEYVDEEGVRDINAHVEQKAAPEEQ